MTAQSKCFVDGVQYCGPMQPVCRPKKSDGIIGSADIVAAATDPKVREANLLKLDSLVVGISLSKVQISSKEVEALEAEARASGFCDYCRCTVRKEDSTVFVSISPKVISQWCPPISYPRLEFTDDGRKVRRPPYVSAFPAAIVPADLEKPTALRFRITAFPANKAIFTVGVAKWPGFKVYFGQGFGQDDSSWGLRWKAEDGTPMDPEKSMIKLSRGDLVCVTCDTWKGNSTISINGKEAGEFEVPCGEHFVLGATLSPGCVLALDV